MSADTDAPAPSRRAFLTGAGLSAAAAGAAALGVTAKTADAKATDQARSGAGYQETAHVRRAYETSSF